VFKEKGQKVMISRPIFDEVNGLYKVIPLKPFRKTPGVSFDVTPPGIIPRIDGIDRVLHENGAQSPGAVGSVDRPWYMHFYQEDYLLVLQGIRYTDIYTPQNGKVESFEVAPQYIKKNGGMFYDGPAMLVWPCNVFHRIRSCDVGSASVNFAVRTKGFNIDTNFSIYDVNIDTGEYKVIREGHLDQD
jgi:hypothetical protein